MVYRKKVKIKGQEYWYLFHTIREGDKFLKKSKYIGKELPKNIKEIEEKFEKEIHGQKTIIKDKPISDEDKIIESLHPLERKVIPFLKFKDAKNISERSKLKDIEVLRALQWLENKKLIQIKKEQKEIINLGMNGIKYVKEKLPEKRFLDNLDKPLTMQELMKKTRLEKDEFTFCVGYLKKNNLIQIGREIIKIKDKSEKISKKDLDINLIENLTPEILAKKSWKGKKFRRYDVSLEVPKIYSGKRHFVNQAIDYAKRIWTDTGFEEMEGEIINESFWNFDALFTPQDHPARELQDSIFLDRKSEIKEKELLKKIKEMHENGAGISKGWQYKWDVSKAEKLVMRTHTTVLSAKTLYKLKDKKGKFFAIGRNFRNEAVDWSHGFEFNQTEGIVIDPNANFRHLLGYLKE